MGSNNYTARSQGRDDEIEKEHLLSFSDGTNDASMEVPRRKATSPQWIGMAVIMLLLINASCLLVTMHQLHLASQALRQHLNFADNRDLPRPDPYDGL
ncbi:hypothetical protein EV363DRAFT_1429639 [Boletus edulis]|uniref:Uncharacterized protein n=1 Tax=Boletus edulis BED1 TaxID=1328754 RepID=A0AAD4BXF2_BOLED|nr:hypothetical protein EV363DRAFT_1429639 [Boletus edulis]KAF8442446.1 hypothetical protein L210DRAFT_938479 [Boletus edulis BED1]